jgi:aspartyl-tRNA(Asn)/glutamyl-tRNA(Gln) amidotransferase subunit C
VFREDVVTNGDEREQMEANAPKLKDGSFVVPRTVE